METRRPVLPAALPGSGAAVVRAVPEVEVAIATVNAVVRVVLLEKIDLTVKEATLLTVVVDAVGVTTMIHLPEATVIEIMTEDLLLPEATTIEDLPLLVTTEIEDLP